MVGWTLVMRGFRGCLMHYSFLAWCSAFERMIIEHGPKRRGRQWQTIHCNPCQETASAAPTLRGEYGVQLFNAKLLSAFAATRVLQYSWTGSNVRLHIQCSYLVNNLRCYKLPVVHLVNTYMVVSSLLSLLNSSTGLCSLFYVFFLRLIVLSLSSSPFNWTCMVFTLGLHFCF